MKHIKHDPVLYAWLIELRQNMRVASNAALEAASIAQLRPGANVRVQAVLLSAQAKLLEIEAELNSFISHG